MFKCFIKRVLIENQIFCSECIDCSGLVVKLIVSIDFPFLNTILQVLILQNIEMLTNGANGLSGICL